MPTAARRTARASLAVRSQSRSTSPQVRHSSVVVVVSKSVVVEVDVVVVHSGSSISPTHSPLTQTSPTVQGFVSLHSPVLFALTQRLPSSSHESSVHSFSSSQPFGPPAVQVPATQVSPDVQKSPSSQGAELLMATQRSSTSLQESDVQTSSSSQTRAAPMQVPSVQTSSTVQKRPSSQASVFGAFTHASPSSSHESSVQSVSSEQSRAVPLQVPPAQVPSTTQNTPASQGSVLFV